ncbi:MAG: tetratricopeptide repeat protein [Chloroflexi bacterium]|nr:tetratricopeptide repeat protein [Chloroflexota bacterium]
MTVPFLTTKFYIPPVRPGLISRPRLIEQLNAGLWRNDDFSRKLTIVSAPPGFGKTELLSEWVSSVERPVAWVSLDRDDNNPARFWAGLITALQTIRASMGETALALLHSSQTLPIKPILATLINEIAEETDALTLVLDDYHVIESQSIHDTLAFVLDHLPPKLHLILSTRVEPLLPLGHLRSQRQLNELGTDDLRFTFDEVNVFLNQVMSLNLSDEDLLTLTARTEGWIAGLQMAALTLQRTLSMHGQEVVHNSIKTFSGSHRYIMDYMTEHVLRHQPAHVRTFLLQTSILDHLTGPLCDAVRFGAAETPSSSEGFAACFHCTETPNSSQGILDQLEAANLFVTALDDDRCWYRYHHLFAELLRQQLSRTQPKLVPILHRRASEWYEENGLLLKAMRHALAAEDIERMVHLVEENALVMMGHGDQSIILGWLDTLPGDVVRSRPWLCVLRAWALAYAARVDAVELWLREAEKALANVKRQTLGSILSQAEEQHLLGHIATIRAYGMGWQGEMSWARELARQALELLPENDLMARGFAALHLAKSSRWDGDLAAAAQAYTKASAINQVAGNSHITILAKCCLAELLIVQGQLYRAADVCQEAQRLAKKVTGQAGGQLPISGFVHILKSKVLRHWNQLEAATRQVVQGIELCDQWGQVEFTLIGYNELARILQERGDADGALDACWKSMQIARGISFWPVAHADALGAWLRLAQGDVAAAARWAERNGLDVEDDVTFQYEFLYLALARLLIAQKKTEKALDLLARLLEIAETLGAIGSTIEILVLQAVTLQAQGETDQALAALERALTLAEPEGYVRVFVDEGVPMIHLLRQVAARSVATTRWVTATRRVTATRWVAWDYVCKLLAALEAEQDRSSPISETLIEPLSEREMQVLRLIVMGLSNREITESLCVSINTIKTHVKTIYGKLNVHNRVQAAGRARELRLM